MRLVKRLVEARIVTDGMYDALVALIEHSAARSEEEEVKTACTELIQKLNGLIAECKRRRKVIAYYNALRRKGVVVDEQEVQDAIEGTGDQGTGGQGTGIK